MYKGRNILYKFNYLWFKYLGVVEFQRFLGREEVTDIINHNGACRTVSATYSMLIKKNLCVNWFGLISDHMRLESKEGVSTESIVLAFTY